jgi:hypothetical protein
MMPLSFNLPVRAMISSLSLGLATLTARRPITWPICITAYAPLLTQGHRHRLRSVSPFNA